MIVQFKRKFQNPDMTSCWLNACLQLIFSAFDHEEQVLQFSSELGEELLRFHQFTSVMGIDPTSIKDIIVYTEDMRIATRKSELMNATQNRQDLENQLRNIDDLYLNLKTGQQCVRDFFLCISESMKNWIDIYQFFSITTVNSSKCLACKHKNLSEQNQLYLEMDVPPDGSSLGEFVEDHLMGTCIVDYHCEDGCKVKFHAEKRTSIKSVQETQYIIVILRRSIATDEGITLVENKIDATHDLTLR